MIRLALAVLLIASSSSAADLQATADAHFQAGRWSDAAEAYAAVVAEHPTDGEAWLRLGLARLRLQRPADAVPALSRAWELEHRPASAAFALARAHAMLGDPDAALVWLDRSADAGGTYATAVLSLPEFEGLHDRPELAAVVERMRPCSTPEHRQFDFWLGRWEVHAAARPDAPPAHNVITSQHDGCVIQESYRSPTGYTGSSLNYYDPGDGRWHQTWMDNQGQPLVLSGGLQGSSMVLRSDPEGSPLNRITWTPSADGTVRQLWERSGDGGDTWKVVFDGTYRLEEAGR